MVSPILVGVGLAAGDRVFGWSVAVAVLVVGLGTQIAANFANDVSDAIRGADPPDRKGPPRMVSQGVISARAMWVGVVVALAVAGSAGVYLWSQAGWLVPVLGVLSVLGLLGYVGGPIPYGYRGWGEASVFIFFGLAATVGSRYVFDRSVPAEAWWLAIPMGLLASSILVANNLRDLDSDRSVGKSTLAVKFGSVGAVWLYTFLVWGALVVVTAGVVLSWLPVWSLLVWVTSPATFLLTRSIRNASQDHRGDILNGLLANTALLHLAFGALLGLTSWLNI